MVKNVREDTLNAPECKSTECTLMQKKHISFLFSKRATYQDKIYETKIISFKLLEFTFSEMQLMSRKVSAIFKRNSKLRDAAKMMFTKK